MFCHCPPVPILHFDDFEKLMDHRDSSYYFPVNRDSIKLYFCYNCSVLYQHYSDLHVGKIYHHDNSNQNVLWKLKKRHLRVKQYSKLKEMFNLPIIKDVMKYVIYKY